MWRRNPLGKYIQKVTLHTSWRVGSLVDKKGNGKVKLAVETHSDTSGLNPVRTGGPSAALGRVNIIRAAMEENTGTSMERKKKKTLSKI